MLDWLRLPAERRIEIINQVNSKTGFSREAIEKDWWVTLTLFAVTKTPWIGNMVFKGGTSLSKGWALISRFSEDIDLAMDRIVLDPENNVSNPSQLRKLRRRSAAFMGDPFPVALDEQLRAMAVTTEEYRLTVKLGPGDEDPRQIWLHYDSLFETDAIKEKPDYIAPKVIVEIGARSLREPCSPRPITSLISQHFPGRSFAALSFDIETVEPQRTLMEKIFLLHEEKRKELEKRRILRLSRHYSDLKETAETGHMQTALTSPELFRTIRDHRHQFSPIPGCDYVNLCCRDLDFLPYIEDLPKWKEDYKEMQINMIGSNPPSFEEMMAGLDVLQARIRALDF